MDILFENILNNFDWRMLVMWVIGGLLIFLAIKKGDGTFAAAADRLRRDPCKPAALRRNNTDDKRRYRKGRAECSV